MSPAGRVAEIGLEVVERARQGDPEAFEAVVRHYDPGLRALAYRLVGDRDRMDDVLQEAYLRAFHSLPRFRRQAALGTWLYRIVYNACLDELRRSRRTTVVPLERIGEPADPQWDFGEALARRYDLARALAGLSPQDRAVVLLVDAQGLDYRAAAEVVGVAPGTIASRLHRARGRLRSALGEHEGGAE